MFLLNIVHFCSLIISISDVCIQISVNRAQSWCDSLVNTHYYETSAKENVNIHRAFEEIARCALREEPTVSVFDHLNNKDRINMSDKAANEDCSFCYC